MIWIVLNCKTGKIRKYTVSAEILELLKQGGRVGWVDE